MRELFRTLPLMCAVLMIPVLPFLFFGGSLDQWIGSIAKHPPSDTVTVAAVIGLLATDILLPIPSSVVITMGGWQLGWWMGGLSAWIGLSLGAALGFGFARQWGEPFARWFSKTEDLRRMKAVSDRYGPLVLILTRAVPVLAEASILIVGIHKLSWNRFLPAMLLSNLAIAVAYSAFGDYAKEHQWLPLALTAAIGIPILIAAGTQRFLPKISDKKTEKELI